MLKRSPSRVRSRTIRCCSTSPRVHQENVRFFACICLVLLLFSVVFIYTKLGSLASHGSSQEFSLGRRFVTELSDDESEEENGNVIARHFQEEVDPSHFGRLMQLEDTKGKNDSSSADERGYMREDEEDTLEDDDIESDGELHMNEVDDFDNTENNSIDDNDNADVLDESEQQRDNADKKDENFSSQTLKEVNSLVGMANSETMRVSEDKHDAELYAKKVMQDNTENRQVDDDKHIDKRLDASDSLIEKSQIAQSAVKSLSRSMQIKTIPRWDPLEGLGSYHNVSSNPLGGVVGKKRNGVIWDHLLGVARMKRDPKAPREFQEDENIREMRNVVGLPINQSDNSEPFSSDDQSLNQNINNKLEEVQAIEDVLLLPNEKGKIGLLPSWVDTSGKKANKGNANRRDRSIRTPLDPLNPANNPLLQDPDSIGPNGLTATDKAFLKALHRAESNKDMKQVGKVIDKTSPANAEGNGESSNSLVAGGNAAKRSMLETSECSDLKNDRATRSVEVEQDDLILTEKQDGGTAIKQSVLTKEELYPEESSPDTRKWGFFPGLDPSLTFSEFLHQFLMNSNCSIRIFMAWTTPPWTYTVRYQRTLESLLHFHPYACVVVFSESVELNFFSNFVQEGFKIAVVAPNLEELLEGTPADIFASVWLAWRKVDLFHIHYTELIRLAALYRYGGVYLDADVVVLKSLDSLQNAIGIEASQGQVQKLNGAIMVFEKYSSFIWECLIEFTATYDDQLLEFNGAELLTRVVHKAAANKSGKQMQPLNINILPAHTFFPLTRQNIIRYFRAPRDQQKQSEDDHLLKIISTQSLTLHFWNQKTKHLVPEAGSLVERFLNMHCIHCSEYL